MDVCQKSTDADPIDCYRESLISDITSSYSDHTQPFPKRDELSKRCPWGDTHEHVPVWQCTNSILFISVALCMYIKVRLSMYAELADVD